MTRRFCDACGEEIAESVAQTRLKADVRATKSRHVRILFEIMAGTGDAINVGDLCAGCLLDAIASIDTRPQDAAPTEVAS